MRHLECGPLAKAQFAALFFPILAVCQAVSLHGTVTDPDGRLIAGADIHLARAEEQVAQTKSDSSGRFAFYDLRPGKYTLRAEAHVFADVNRDVAVSASSPEDADVQFNRVADQRQTMVITAKSLEPAIDLRNSEVFNRTLFTRDDQVLQQLNAGINAGQHEGGGKSLEIRRFGFNLDHGGVNGGLKVLVDDVGQNQGT